MNNDPWKYLGWAAKGIATTAKAGAWAVSTAQSAAQAAELRDAIDNASKPPDPMDGLAMGDDLLRFQYAPETFYLGKIHEDHHENFEAGIHDDRGVFIVAGAGAGKGTSFYIQNCLRWPGSLVCVDPKGEAASITAMRRGTAENAKGTGTSVRSFIGQDVAVLDPLGEVRGPARCYRVNYNPLGDVDISRGGGVRQIRAIASGMVVPEKGDNAHFSESAETIISGVIEMMMMAEKDPARRNLPNVREILLSGRDAVLFHLTQLERPGSLAQEALAILEDVGGDEWSAYRSTLSRALRWMAEPDIKDHLRQSNFSLWDIVQKGGSLFIVLPSDQIDDYKSWLRIIIRLALAAKMALGTNQTGPKTLFLLDEFAALGHMRILEKAVAEMRGYGIKLVPVIQNIGQIQGLYGKNWETFLANSAAIIAWGLNDGETEKYIAERMGRLLRQEVSVGGSSGGGGMNLSSGQSVNTSLQERAVRFHNEIREQGATETMRAFVIPASGKALTVRRQPYMNLARHKLYDGPDHIRAWEQKRSQKGR